MKIGDLIEYQHPYSDKALGTIIEFPKASHPKEFQKVRVLTSGEVQNWIMQFCKIYEEDICKL